MAKKFVPKICGDNGIYIPDRGCTDCEQLEQRVEVLEECCEEVKEELDGKLGQRDIKQGENVSLSYNADGTVTISAVGGGGGGGEVTKTAILAALGYQEFDIVMTDENDVSHTWRIIGTQID